jgi:hypothetical protein
VHPITKIDIGDPTLAKHHLSSGSAPVVKGVASFVLSSSIRLCLSDDPSGYQIIYVGEKLFSNQLFGNKEDVILLVET